MVLVEVKALSHRRLVLDKVVVSLKGHQHSNNSSNRVVVIREEVRVGIKEEDRRAVIKVEDSLKEEEAGFRGVVMVVVVEGHNVVVGPSSIMVDHLTNLSKVNNRGLQEELHHHSVVVVDLRMLVDLLGHQFPSCTKQRKLLSSLWPHCSLCFMRSCLPLSRQWMSQQLNFSCSLCSKKSPFRLPLHLASR